MAKYLIIFGAGASFGSDTTNIPPLGADLFDALRQFNPDGWGQVNGQLAEDFRADFEATMPQLNAHALPPLQRAMAAYFFRFQPTQNSLYFRLARTIGNANWDGAFVSLNYEGLLEISLAAAGLQPFIGSAPSHAKPIELCLPHGACHIFCQAVRGLASAVSFAGMNVRTNGPVEVIANPQDFQNRITTEAFPPVMSYFEPSKRTTSGSNFIDQQRNRYSTLVGDAEVVVIIGLRVREHDSHIWKPLSQAKAKIVYCSGKTGGEEFQKWSQEKRNNNDVVLNTYFSEGFERLLSELNLHSS